MWLMRTHAFVDVVPQALVGGGGGWGHGGILALWEPVLGRDVTGGGTDLMELPRLHCSWSNF
jgi:hypothetical protein